MYSAGVVHNGASLPSLLISGAYYFKDEILLTELAKKIAASLATTESQAGSGINTFDPAPVMAHWLAIKSNSHPSASYRPGFCAKLIRALSAPSNS